MRGTDQRMYASSYGRFNTADPMKSSGTVNDPGSWNRYAYVQGDPVSSSDPAGLLAAAATNLPGFDPDMLEQAVCLGQTVDYYVDGSFANSACIIGAAKGVAEVVAPQPTCDQGLNPVYVSYVQSDFSSALGLSIATGSAMNADFILAWGAVESNFGTSYIAQDNHNFFGDRDCKDDPKTGGCIANTNPGHTAPWIGAMPCGSAGSGSPNLGFACFSGDSGFFQSGWAAIFAHNGRDVTIAQSMPNATPAQLAQAIANGGHCTEGNCLNGGYGTQVQNDYNKIAPIVNCLFPWYKP